MAAFSKSSNRKIERDVKAERDAAKAAKRRGSEGRQEEASSRAQHVLPNRGGKHGDPPWHKELLIPLARVRPLEKTEPGS
jgi:hypothetical protein